MCALETEFKDVVRDNKLKKYFATYRIGIKHNGAVIATTELSEEDEKKLLVSKLTFIVELFEKKFGLDISQYRLSEYESLKRRFLIYIRNEDLEKIREEKLTKLGL